MEDDCRHAVVICPEPRGKDGIQVYARSSEASHRGKEESSGRHSGDRSSGLRVVNSHHSRGFSRSKGSDECSFPAHFDGFSSGESSQDTSALKTKESDPDTNKGSSSDQPSVEDFGAPDLTSSTAACRSHHDSSRRSKASSGRGKSSSSLARSRVSIGDCSQDTSGRQNTAKESHPDLEEEPFVDRASGFFVVKFPRSAQRQGRGSRSSASDREVSSSLQARLHSSEVSNEVFDSVRNTRSSGSRGHDPYARTAVAYGSEVSA